LGEWTVRRMVAEDYGDVLDLWERAGLASVRGRGRVSREAVRRQLRLDSSVFLVAEAEGRIVGVVLGSHDGRKGWISRLAVDPEFRRRGIAQDLILKVEEALRKRGIRVFSALILKANKPSQRLFTKMGYRGNPFILYVSKRLDEEA